MFEKETYPEDLSSINIAAYSSEKSETKCELPCNSIVLFILLGFFFIFIGIAELISNYQANYIVIPMVREANVLWNPQEAYFSFKEDENVGLYLQIQNLTQFSRTDSAKYREIEKNPASSQNCIKYKTNKELGKTVAIDGTSLSPDQQAIPCGFYQGMFPSGTVTVSLGSGAILNLTSQDLTFFSYNFLNVNRSKQWTDLETQPFQSWMEHNAGIGTTKLMGHLPTNFTGLVQVNITSTSAFNGVSNGLPGELGDVTVILASTKAFANRNISFCIANFFQSACLFLFAFIIFFYNKLIDREVEQNCMPCQQLELKTQLESESVKSSPEPNE